MADVLTAKQRSYNMSRIKGTNTKPEEIVRKYLFSCGFRYRKNDKRYPGSPDIVLPKNSTVVFVNGCFWHKHEGCHYFVWPKSNPTFWKEKIEKNAERDKRDYELLHKMGWSILIVWECELKEGRAETTLQRLAESIRLNQIESDQKHKTELYEE